MKPSRFGTLNKGGGVRRLFVRTVLGMHRRAAALYSVAARTPGSEIAHIIRILTDYIQFTNIIATGQQRVNPRLKRDSIEVGAGTPRLTLLSRGSRNVGTIVWRSLSRNSDGEFGQAVKPAG
jgi:hypothetical protein